MQPPPFVLEGHNRGGQRDGQAEVCGWGYDTPENEVFVTTLRSRREEPEEELKMQGNVAR